MMAKSFQSQRANVVVGVFVLSTAAILIIAVALGPNTRRWLTPTNKLTVRLPPEGSLGLRKGADLLILGTVVGSVDDITVSDAGEMEAVVSVRADFIRFVRRDSQAFIRKPLGIGDAMIEITRGKGEAMPPGGLTIQAIADKAPTQMLEETLADIRTEIVPAIREARAAVDGYTRLAADLRSQQPGITAAVAHFNRMTDDVEGGKGVVGMLMSDPTAADSVRQTLPKLSASIEDVRLTTADLRKFAATLPELKRSAQHSLDEAPGLLLEVQETSRQLQLLIKALQRNWLVRGGMDSPVQDSKIGADQVGTDR